MNTCLHHIVAYFDYVIHPAAGKMLNNPKKKRTAANPIHPKATPDSLNIRELIKRQDSFRRNPAP